MCEPGALKVGAAYIYVDWRACTECYKCVDVCDRGAIVKRDTSSQRRPSGGTKPAFRPRAGTNERPSRQGAWTLLEAGALLALMLVAFIIKDTVLNSDAVTVLSPSSAVFARVVVLAGFYGIQVLALWFLVQRRGVAFSKAFSMGRLRTSIASKATSVGLVVALLVGTRAAAWIWGVMASALGWDAPGRVNGNITDLFGPDTFGLVLAVILVVAVGPVIEEVIFRSVLLDAFGDRFGFAVALVAQSALFALYHFTPWMLVPTFILGLASGWIAHTRESLWPAIALHALYNAIPVAIAFWLVG